jgi:hypothetical protein
MTDVLFETGYGPSGLLHIGAFGEVARTSMVRHPSRRWRTAAVVGRHKLVLSPEEKFATEHKIRALAK